MKCCKFANGFLPSLRASLLFSLRVGLSELLRLHVSLRIGWGGLHPAEVVQPDQLYILYSTSARMSRRRPADEHMLLFAQPECTSVCIIAGRRRASADSISPNCR